MKCTNNGLMNFEKERNSILKDAQNLITLCQSDTGHLGDAISCIRTTISSLKIKADSLSEIFENQKSANICPTCGKEHHEEDCNGFCSADCLQSY